MTLREALAAAFHQLSDNPHLRDHAMEDAAYLLLHALEISRASMLANYDRILTAEELAVYQRMIARRLGSEPLQYITGDCEFYSLPLRVNPAVLIPRPETEHLVETVLCELDPTQALRIVDVGTGSGAIAIALAVHLPRAQITALDLSAAALEVAAANARTNGLAGRIRFLESDLLAALSSESALEPLGWDAIVSNPPYVPAADRDSLHPQVRDYEPSLALFAGPSGLDVYRRLIPQARAALKPNGLLALEIGFDQRDAIAALLADWNGLRFIDDLQHIPRVAVARKP